MKAKIKKVQLPRLQWPAWLKIAIDKASKPLAAFYETHVGSELRRNTTLKKFIDPLHTAMSGIATHQFRSFLTILGVVIGVAAVISLMSVGRGTQAQILSSVQNLGANLLFISPGSTSSSGIRSAMGSATTLTADDATAIAKQVSYIEAVAPTQRANAQVIAGDSNMNSSITGVTPDYQQVLGLEIADGNFFSQNQYDSASKVAVLGYTAKDNLFGDSDAVGEQIRVGNGQFKVIGTLKEKGTSMLANTDTAIFIPLTTLRQTVNATRTSSGAYTVNQIIVSLTDRKYSAAAIADMTSLLETRHRITAGADDDFSITSQEDIVATITKASGSMTMLLGAIAAISLLVGGIGVMNIMLVSVIERTREIGIRKALGAHERDIWMQFLIEAGILTLTGGIIGVIIGWIVAVLIQVIGGTATVVSADIIILAISVSIAIGVFFGFYPAWQASRLNPIDALRSE